MTKLVVPFLLSLVLLSGCARYYVIKMTNGTKITTIGKPKLKGAHYEFTDYSRKKRQIPEGRVSEIEPASMAKREESVFLNPTAK